MIRPLYRWKSFWFGVLVIAFLGWASWHSTSHHARLRIRQVMVIHTKCQTHLVRLPSYPGPRVEIALIPLTETSPHDIVLDIASLWAP